ncbi:MAG TPA: Holliday junction resolvase RuvX [Campylobacterales bacterium]|nr:Holliday junction resolvase RuvX [Campylobacterales bacterium]
MSVVAIDVGLKRIGVAVLVSGIAVASEPIIRKNREQASRDVSVMLKAKKAEKLVVGLPKGGASEEEMERRIKHFISLLEFDGEIVYADEYGSSREALEIAGGGLTKNKDGRVDSLAALVILKRWANLL